MVFEKRRNFYTFSCEIMKCFFFLIFFSLYFIFCLKKFILCSRSRYSKLVKGNNQMPQSWQINIKCIPKKERKREKKKVRKKENADFFFFFFAFAYCYSVNSAKQERIHEPKHFRTGCPYVSLLFPVWPGAMLSHREELSLPNGANNRRIINC